MTRMDKDAAQVSKVELDGIEKAVKRNGSYECGTPIKASKVAKELTGRGIPCRASSRGVGLPARLVVAE